MLASARLAAGLKQYQVAQLISTEADIVSADTISNWECNRAMPDPEQVAAMERLYEASGLWDAWMRLQWPSFHERIPEAVKPSTSLEAVVRLGVEASDVREMLDPLLRDLVDGKIHDQEFADRFITALEESEAAHRTAREALKNGGYRHGA